MRLFISQPTHTNSLASSSTLSSKCANEARAAVLSYFNASSDYTVVFTANASAALKLVAEAYPFASGSSLVIGADSHNSVNIPYQFIIVILSHAGPRFMESENLLPPEGHELVTCHQRLVAVSMSRRRRYVIHNQ
jgi:Aminotransferase class-V